MNRFCVLLQLSRNDIRARYAGSLFGILWAFALPLVTILVFWYVFELGFRNAPVDEVPYILWFSAAYIPWVFFTDCTSSGCRSLVEYSCLVRKIRFDVRIIPMIKAVSAAFVHAFFVLFLLVMYRVCGYRLRVYSLQLLYYASAAVMLGMGLNWFLSAVTVFFNDMSALYSLVIQVGFWVTPILWNEETMVNESVRRMLSLNPMHYIVNGYRDSLLSGRLFWDRPGETALFWGITAGLWTAGLLVFEKLRPFFADEV